MTLFMTIAAALLLLALAVPMLALRRAAPRASGAGVSNLELLKAQLRQLDQDLAQGALDAAQHRSARAEIERRVLDEESVASGAAWHAGSPRATLVLLGLAVPALVLALYAWTGNPAALSPHARNAPQAPDAQQVEQMVERLAERMEQRPPGNVDDTEGWVMLGRSYGMMQRYAEASRAFARALQLMPEHPQILVDQADMLAMQQGGTLQGEPLRLIEQALRHDPSNPKALALAGTAAYHRKDFAAALRYWTRARDGATEADGEFAHALDRSIADARAAAGLAATPAPSGSTSGRAAASAAATAAATTPATPPAGVSAPRAGAGSIRGRVSLDPALAAKVSAADTLYVLARAAQGPRLPLAILKRSVADLPLQFTLDDSMAMSPQLKLSQFDDVVVSARISKSGDAMPQSGDLEGHSPPLGGRSSGIEVRIDRVRP
jgi:cytochrome c-type biogenesis protein CcmH